MKIDRNRLVITVESELCSGGEEVASELAKKLGCDYGVNSGKEGFMDRVDEITDGKGFDYVYETAGNTITMKMAFKLAANKAGLCFIGTPTRELTFTVDEWENMNRTGERFGSRSNSSSLFFMIRS